ncbi:NADH-quinone oxidoreductase subunit L [Ahniella affigens]|uniref:NADH-quinone oxidoreductase subunit L n=1 Tax=Ahniella affigens TaxID=2021234 RepID=A0A2P1PR41_9GAMM|nr:NADH-quinone oxidoreductase subunit L [Ahniella affigens]AVP97310.1 NADH-quinone oxidoreductase subunit L [Ahniella affigens]
MKTLLIIIALAPLFGAILAGLFGRQIGRIGAHTVTIGGVALSCILSLYVFKQLAFDNAPVFNENLYTWFEIGGYSAHVGFLIDRLTAMMMVVVTFVSLMVHVYTIGYMEEDPGYQRFFSYIALFTFSMLMLVMSNNFLQLFFGWEAVGLVSYLLIGFWFKRPSAIFANMKAFLVNRVGDFGFLLGIAAVLWYFGSLDYATVFANRETISGKTIEILAGHAWAVPTVIGILLFIGAMGKSAQVPLHVWLPDSMEGPTPISALIHAATMVTAGIFMVARMSPLYELSETALAFIAFTGATTALFTGLIGLVQNDIKRVVAYSTLSQLGYMTVALGVSAYNAAVFHLMTHAFFKALLFLGAGSVIMAMHHEQDMRHMGGLKKYMPITYWTGVLGTLALVGTPFFSGFYSKDAIIVAAEHASGSHGGVFTYAYVAVLLGVFVTSLYSFRLLFLTFHGQERFKVVAPAHHEHHDGADADGHDDHDDHHHTPGELAHPPHESPWVVTVPLVLLAIPSVAIAWFFAKPMLLGDFFQGAIYVDPSREPLGHLAEHFHSVSGFAIHGLMTLPFWLAFAGFALAAYVYLFNRELATKAYNTLRPLARILENKYGFDALYQAVFARGSVLLGRGFWKAGDTAVIDGALVNGSAALIDRLSLITRSIQTGFLYHYAFAMILGLIVLLSAFLWLK